MCILIRTVISQFSYTDTFASMSHSSKHNTNNSSEKRGSNAPEADDRVQFTRAAFGRVVRVLAELEPVQHRQPHERLRLQVQPLQQLPTAHALQAAAAGCRRRALRRRATRRLHAQPEHRAINRGD